VVTLPTAIDVLLVEDDPADAYMVGEALGGWHRPTKLHVTSDGEQAAAFLRRLAPYADAPRPAFVLLDLNMPRRNGFEFLEDIKRDANLSVIPVVVFTSSADPDHVLRSYASHANAYVVKPTDFADYERTVRDIEHFYTQISVPAPGDAR
jgi:CheY-like chemotaxis protein